MNRGRTEAFSDGIFAIATTLLVLELRPPTGEQDWAKGLVDTWPSYLAYVVSFLTIGIMWLNHHTMFAHVVRVNRPLLVLNLLLLMVVAVVPFPTALVGEALKEHLHGENAQVAVAVYGLTMILMSIGFTAVWLYVVSHPALLDNKLPPHVVRRSIPRFSVGFVAYIVATLIALVQPLAALIIFGILAIYYAFEHLPSPVAENEA